MRYLLLISCLLLAACVAKPAMRNADVPVGHYQVMRSFVAPEASLTDEQVLELLDFRERVIPALGEKLAGREDGRRIDLYIDVRDIRAHIAYPASPIGSDQSSVITRIRLVDYNARQLLGEAELNHYVDFTPGMDEEFRRRTLAQGYADELAALLYPDDPLQVPFDAVNQFLPQ